jgi:uncharacterized protein DUF3558
MRVALVAVAAILLAGCTTVSEESPQPSSRMALPPRPREVRLNGVDPCTLLTRDQRNELMLDSEPLNGVLASSGVYKGDVPTCTMRGFGSKATSMGVGLVTTTGIDIWTAGDLAADVMPIRVAGFPAVVAIPTRFSEYCSVDVDVSAGQLVDVQYRDGGNQPQIPQRDLCGRARACAEAIMFSLLAR